MLQSIRAPTLAMPSFGHNMSLNGPQKMEDYADTDAWQWPQSAAASSSSYTPIFDQSHLYAHLNAQQPVPGSVQRHHSIATSHIVTGRSTPPGRHQIAGPIVKAQPAFKPTWHGFLDTTKDAMTIVEAALQGRLGHISRRPHDKERAEMLTSGTVLVYEENASGIRRWTDAVHWSPSRVMNNCLIYRQLTRALKPEEKRSALNPTCGGKRKRKEGGSPSITKAGDNVNNSDDEYDSPIISPSTFNADGTPAEKTYANFAQSLSPEQQRRFCGSLIDSYEFKEGGLMKKTISVKYQGTNHHIISYYTLEDVVNGKLKRPCQDDTLRDIVPRPELLTGWKVSLEDEESKDQYPQQMHASHLAMQSQGMVQSRLATGPPQVYVSTNWTGNPMNHYSPTHQSPQHYTPNQSVAHPYVPSSNLSQYPVQQASPQHMSPQVASPVHQYPAQTPPATQYHHGQQATAQSHYGPPPASYLAAPQEAIPQVPQHTISQAQVLDFQTQASAYRRTSAPMVMQQPFSQPHYSAAPPAQNPSYYVPDAKYNPSQGYGY